MKPRVLMIAYACNPRGSGEHWLGWGWAEQAARAYEVELITTTNNRSHVEEAARACGIKPHFVGVPEWFRKITNVMGGAGNWIRKIWWQFRVAKLAESLHRQSPFAVVHQTTFHTFRVPFLAARLGIPAVWGPIAGGESVPPGFYRFVGSQRLAEHFRSFANQLWLYFPPVTTSLRRASVIFVSNRTTLDFLPREFHDKCRIVPPNALRSQDEKLVPTPRTAFPNGTLRLLYVGNCVATRALPLVFEALVESRITDFKLTIVGGGPALESWKRDAARLNLSDKITFTGLVPYETLPQYYDNSDALVFPALRDSGGSALLEAMSRNLPVICLDWAGPGEMVDKDCGIKIPVHDPQRTVTAFAEALKRLKQEPALGATLARAAQRRALSVFRWEEKFRLLQSTYERLIKAP
jgi:glycosyltransferase involved in cell wall biosynthesis